MIDIFDAAKKGDIKQIKYWIEQDINNVNKRDSDGATALIFAAMRGHRVSKLTICILYFTF